MVSFAPFSTNGYFTIFEYIIYQNQLSPCHRKMLLFAFYSLHNNYENQNSMRFKSFKFHVNSIYKSQKINLIRWFFVIWIENVNAVVKMNLINFNSMWYYSNVWTRTYVNTLTTHEMKFSINNFFSEYNHIQSSANLVTFTEEILNGKL